ncbi:MAG: hypothetical protein GAK37_00970 [Pseudomonas sp.]|nr:MAG: hypothetical protein GAK37_00970 [Pseudomonas sp.]
MKTLEIKIIKNNVQEAATIEYDRGNPALTIHLNDGTKKTYIATDLYESFGLLREDLKEITFLCKGSKINVHTSGMSSSMSNGLVAYELTLGEPGEKLVRIFDYEESNLTSDIQQQRIFYEQWTNSF